MERLICLDTETTGLDPNYGHRIIEIGCIEVINRAPTGKTFHKYLNPDRDVPLEAFQVHGLSGDFLKDKPRFEEIAEEMLEFMADSPFIIHNAAFDMKFLNFELERMRREALSFDRAIDTLLMARKKFPGSPASLDALCKRFNVDSSRRTRHGALLDAELLVEVYRELTGGAQDTLSLDTPTQIKGTHGLKAQASNFKRKAPLIIASEDEKAAHDAFIKTLSNPLWTKA